MLPAILLPSLFSSHPQLHIDGDFDFCSRISATFVPSPETVSVFDRFGRAILSGQRVVGVFQVVSGAVAVWKASGAAMGVRCNSHSMGCSMNSRLCKLNKENGWNSFIRRDEASSVPTSRRLIVILVGKKAGGIFDISKSVSAATTSAMSYV